MFRMKNTTYTVREVAAIISGSNDPKVIDRVVRQVRYWTNDGFLNPVGGKHTGSGRHREYNAHEVKKAAVIAELVRHGVSVSKLCPFEEYLDGLITDFIFDDKENYYLVHAEEFGETGGNMSVVGSDDRSPLRIVDRWDEASMIDFMNYPTCIIINLAKLFSKLDL